MVRGRKLAGWVPLPRRVHAPGAYDAWARQAVRGAASIPCGDACQHRDGLVWMKTAGEKRDGAQFLVRARPKVGEGQRLRS